MTIYRNSVWFFIGLRDFNKSGYDRHAALFGRDALDVDMTGKVVVVTGANSGLGKATAQTLYAKGATVHMLCRNAGRGEQARREIMEKLEKDGIKLRLHEVDIGDPVAVRAFVERFSVEEERLHILVNNAGVMANERAFTPAGMETNFAINTVGTYYLTQQLLPLLKQANGEARVVTVSSGGMLLLRLDVKDLQHEKMSPFDGKMVYAQNKRAQVELTNFWAKQHHEIKFLSMHPGWADTPGLAKSMSGFYDRFKSSMRTTEEGADTIVWAACSKEVMGVPSGSFLLDRAVVSQHLPLARTQSTPAEVEKLVSECENWIKITLNRQDGNEERLKIPV